MAGRISRLEHQLAKLRRRVDRAETLLTGAASDKVQRQLQSALLLQGAALLLVAAGVVIALLHH